MNEIATTEIRPITLCAPPPLWTRWTETLGESASVAIYATAMIGLAHAPVGPAYAIEKMRALAWAQASFPSFRRQPPAGTPPSASYQLPLIAIGDVKVPWSTRVADLGKFINLRSAAGPPAIPTDRVLSVVNESTSVDQLIAVQDFLNLSVIQLYPAKHSYAAYRLPRGISVNEREFAMKLLLGLAGPDGPYPFAAITPDATIEIKRQ